MVYVRTRDAHESYIVTQLYVAVILSARSILCIYMQISAAVLWLLCILLWFVERMTRMLFWNALSVLLFGRSALCTSRSLKKFGLITLTGWRDGIVMKVHRGQRWLVFVVSRLDLKGEKTRWANFLTDWIEACCRKLLRSINLFHLCCIFHHLQLITL